MTKKIISLLLVFAITACFFTGCSNWANAKPLPPEASSQETVEAIAVEIAEAVMCYDLLTLARYTALPIEEQGKIVKDVLPRKDVEGYAWEDKSHETFEAFLKDFDASLDRTYAQLQISVENTQFINIEDVGTEFVRANNREILGREEQACAVYEAAAAALDCKKVAVVTMQICYQKSPVTNSKGEVTTYPETEATMEVLLVWVENSWKSYSPTVSGAFHPGMILSRYLDTAI